MITKINIDENGRYPNKEVDVKQPEIGDELFCGTKEGYAEESESEKEEEVKVRREV